MARKAIPKKLRFEVFKRDSFACQYCGASAPTVVLHVDHIEPVAAGGLTTLLNLITSCAACNLGKGPRPLGDETLAAKQLKAAKDLSERLEQLTMMAKWRNGLADIADQQIQLVCAVFERESKFVLTDGDRLAIKKNIKQFGLDSVLSATETSIVQYLKDPECHEQFDKAFKYVGRICFWEKKKLTHPEINAFNHICNVATKVWWPHSRSNLWRVIENAHYEHGIPTDDLLAFARSSSGIMAFERQIDSLIGGA